MTDGGGGWNSPDYDEKYFEQYEIKSLKMYGCDGGIVMKHPAYSG